MFFWIKGIGQNISREEFIYYINFIICISILSRESDFEMNNFVQKL